MSDMKLKIKFKYSYIISILTSFIILCYFAYKGIIAYLIHKELYGGGVDVVITLRGIISLIMLFYSSPNSILKIKDLKSQKKFYQAFLLFGHLFFFQQLLYLERKFYF